MLVIAPGTSCGGTCPQPPSHLLPHVLPHMLTSIRPSGDTQSAGTALLAPSVAAALPVASSYGAGAPSGAAVSQMARRSPMCSACPDQCFAC